MLIKNWFCRFCVLPEAVVVDVVIAVVDSAHSRKVAKKCKIQISCIFFDTSINSIRYFDQSTTTS